MESTTRTYHELLRVSDVMALYRVSRRTVYRWIESEKLKGKKAGGRWMFSRDAVLDVLE